MDKLTTLANMASIIDLALANTKRINHSTRSLTSSEIHSVWENVAEDMSCLSVINNQHHQVVSNQINQIVNRVSALIHVYKYHYSNQDITLKIGKLLLITRKQLINKLKIKHVILN